MASTPLIVLDPGHGRYFSVDPSTGKPINTRYDRHGLVNDSGAVQGRVRETELNDTMVARVALALRALHYEVRLTRRIDDTHPLLADMNAEERAYLKQLNAQAPDILPDRFNARVETGAGEKVLHLSIHANYATNTSARGTEFYIHTDHKADGPSAQWAQVLNEVFRPGGRLSNTQNDIHLKTGIIAPQPYRGSYDGHVVRGLGHEIGAVLAEIGYMTNAQDLKNMRDPAWQKTTAGLIAKATDTFRQAHAQENMLKTGLPSSPDAIPPGVQTQIIHASGALRTTRGGETVEQHETPPPLPYPSSASVRIPTP